MKRRIIFIVLIAVATLIFSSRASLAHEFRPYVITIREIDAGRYLVSWSESALSGGSTALTPVFPTHCSVVEGLGGAILDCGAAGLAGSEIAIHGLAQARVEAIVRYFPSGGFVTTGVLRAGSRPFRVPGGSVSPQPQFGIFLDYIESGADHILRGWDHLLFVLGLLLLVKGARPLVHTITAFTIGHSVTLALAATGAVHVPQAPAEALIALSLMVLAAEIARPEPRSPVARKKPWAMAFLFGLLHGLGFAGALAELGLPQGQIPLALFAFNIGVELGQLAFVLAAMGIALIARRVMRSASKWSSRAPAYVIGALAAFWLIERLIKLGSS